MPRRDDLHSICVLGSGPIVIGQACEFDYAGCQALKVLREDGFRTIVVNSNPATIMTDPGFADRTYIEPLDLEGVADVLGRERPDALLPTMGGQTGLNLARELINKRHEVTVVESDAHRYAVVEQELEHAVQYGDGTELWVLERAGIQRADLVVAVTGDDEDNILICQVAKEKYLCERIIARCNNPRNLQHFELLGIKPAVSATDLILRLIEHEVPKYGLVHLLDLPTERLEIIEVEVAPGCPADGVAVKDIGLPDGSLVISILRDGAGFVPLADSVVEAGDEVLLVLDTGLESKITQRFTAPGDLAA